MIDMSTRPGSDPPPAPPSAAAGPAERVVLDPEALQRLRDLDPSGSSRLMERVASAFDVSAARLMPQLHAAQAAGDAAGIRHVAHTLKSSSASIGAVKLSQLCADIEAVSREGRVDGLADAIAAFHREVTAVQGALKQILDNPS